MGERGFQFGEPLEEPPPVVSSHPAVQHHEPAAGSGGGSRAVHGHSTRKRARERRCQQLGRRTRLAGGAATDRRLASSAGDGQRV
jgi:hypothetical protein